MATATTYLWKGKTAKGETIQGEYKAEDRRDVADYLRKRRIIIQSVRKKPKDIQIKFLQRKGVGVKDLSVFTRQFATMVNAGLPLVQWALPMVLELYHDRQITLERLVEKVSHGPARLFNIVDRGYLREGYWADLVLLDLTSPYRVEREAVLYKCGWSPLEGSRLRSRVVATFVNGQVAYYEGRVNDAVRGQRLAFNR